MLGKRRPILSQVKELLMSHYGVENRMVTEKATTSDLKNRSTLSPSTQGKGWSQGLLAEEPNGYVDGL